MMMSISFIGLLRGIKSQNALPLCPGMLPFSFLCLVCVVRSNYFILILTFSDISPLILAANVNFAGCCWFLLCFVCPSEIERGGKEGVVALSLLGSFLCPGGFLYYFKLVYNCKYLYIMYVYACEFCHAVNIPSSYFQAVWAGLVNFK